MKKKVVPTLWQEVKVKVDIVTSDDIKIYYTGKFQDFTTRYIHVTNYFNSLSYKFRPCSIDKLSSNTCKYIVLVS